MTRPPEIDLVHKTITSDNSGNEGIDSQPHVTINSADFMVCDVQKNSRVMRRYLLSIFRSHIPSLPNAHVEAENNNNATQQPKKSKITCTHSLVSATKTITTSPRPNPDIKPRHDLAVSESKTDRNPVYVGQNNPISWPQKNHQSSKTPLSCISHPGRRLPWPPLKRVQTRPLLTFSSQMTDPDTPGPRHDKCRTGMPPLVCFQRTQ